MSQRDFEPIHPGEIPLQEFLKPMGITQYRLAKDSLGLELGDLGREGIEDRDRIFRRGRFVPTGIDDQRCQDQVHVHDDLELLPLVLREIEIVGCNSSVITPNETFMPRNTAIAYCAGYTG